MSKLYVPLVTLLLSVAPCLAHPADVTYDGKYWYSRGHQFETARQAIDYSKEQSSLIYIPADECEAKPEGLVGISESYQTFPYSQTLDRKTKSLELHYPETGRRASSEIRALDTGDSVVYMTKDDYDKASIKVDRSYSHWLNCSQWNVYNLHVLSSKFAERWHLNRD